MVNDPIDVRGAAWVADGLRKFLQDHGIGSLDRAVIGRALGLLDVNHPPVVNLTGGGKLRRREGRLWVEC